MTDKQTVRDTMKDSLREFFLNTLSHDGNLYVIGNDELNELIPEIADVVFDVLEISPKDQDQPF